MIQLIKKISAHPITGLNRGIKLKSIQYVDFELEEAENKNEKNISNGSL